MGSPEDIRVTRRDKGHWEKRGLLGDMGSPGDTGSLGETSHQETWGHREGQGSPGERVTRRAEVLPPRLTDSRKEPHGEGGLGGESDGQLCWGGWGAPSERRHHRSIPWMGSVEGRGQAAA